MVLTNFSFSDMWLSDIILSWYIVSRRTCVKVVPTGGLTVQLGELLTYLLRVLVTCNTHNYSNDCDRKIISVEKNISDPSGRSDLRSCLWLWELGGSDRLTAGTCSLRQVHTCYHLVFTGWPLFFNEKHISTDLSNRPEVWTPCWWDRAPGAADIWPCWSAPGCPDTPRQSRQND